MDAPVEAPNSQLHATNLDVDLIIRRMDEIPGLKTVYLFGGEPLLCRGIFDLLRCFKNRDVQASFSTNGLLLGRYAEEIVDVAPPT